MKTLKLPSALQISVSSRLLRYILCAMQGLVLATMTTGCVHEIHERSTYRQGLRQDIRHERQEDRRERQDFMRATW